MTTPTYTERDARGWEKLIRPQVSKHFGWTEKARCDNVNSTRRTNCTVPGRHWRHEERVEHKLQHVFTDHIAPNKKRVAHLTHARTTDGWTGDEGRTKAFNVHTPFCHNLTKRTGVNVDNLRHRALFGHECPGNYRVHSSQLLDSLQIIIVLCVLRSESP